MNFWHQIKKPILGLSPMDGVTDAPFRYIVAKYGKPDVMMTEFTNVEGLARNAVVMLDDFLYSETERPIVAQIYGSEPESFYKIAIICCELGFDGVDINMGCPAKNVAARGCGAALIQNPPLAKEIIQQVKLGIRDWVEGKMIEDLGLKNRMIFKVRRMNEARIGLPNIVERKPIPVSVKTRIGFDRVVVEDWVKHLLEEEPVAITLHGRTLKQMYTGSADWEAIARAAEVIHQTSTLVLGNGDIQSLEDAGEKILKSGVDGALIGRSVIGQPGFFNRGDQESKKTSFERFKIMLEHARFFESVKGADRFSAMRKHFGWYCKGVPQAAELRRQMFQTNSTAELEKIVTAYERGATNS
jgi:tRNA-dihydrouridine synthase